jgi:uncharacterized phage protein (TIGR02218 family)
MATNLLCHFDGTNGQTTTVDAAGNVALTMTGCALSTTSPKFGTASLDMASGVSTSNVSAPDASYWYFGAGQFTVEAWVKFTTAPGVGIQSVVAQFGGASNLGWFFGVISGNLAFYYSTTGADNPNVGAAWTPTLNTWHHLAVDRDASNVLRVYVDGVVLASATVSATFFNSTRPLLIGNDENLNRKLTGLIDELRIENTANYGGAFTPPTGPFTPTVAAGVRETQDALLVLEAGDTSTRDTQLAALVLGGTVPNIRETQFAALVMAAPAPPIRVTQYAALPLVEFHADTPITQMTALVLAEHIPCTTQWAETWTITRTDGQVFAYTSLDRPLTFRGVVHSPCNSLSATATEQSTTIGASGNMELLGIISDVGISEQDLYNGLFDFAKFEVWMVPWGNHGGETPFRLMAGTTGTMTHGVEGFKFEVLTGSANLRQKGLLEIFTPSCRYGFGSSLDARCPVNLAAITVAGSATSTAVPAASNQSTRRIVIDATRAEAAGHFDLGILTWTSGANAGASSEIKRFESGTFVLWSPLLFPIETGDTYTATPGCNKSPTDHLRFNADMLDYGGFPDVPGSDSINQFPDAKG